jgi:hypothetical protein
MTDIFNTKYEEFARDLESACPELQAQLAAALALSVDERKKQFSDVVLPFCSPKRDTATKPGFVLPGVAMTDEIWNSMSMRNIKVIQEYLTLLSFSVLVDSGKQGDLSGSEWTADWAKSMMEDMKEKMENIDFAGISAKIAAMFGAAGAPGADGLPGGIPKIPEKFMRGHIAKLAEEIVKEINLADFGIDPKEFEATSNDPTKALQMIMDLFTKDSRAFQNTIMKLTKRLQQKIQSGSIKPQDLVTEAEELMKTFNDNPQFVELMESFRKAFSFADQSAANAAGRENEGRLSLVRERLRKKLEKRKGGK